MSITPTSTIEIKAIEAPQGNRTIWAVGDNIATIYQDRDNLTETQGMYWVDLAPGIADENTLFHAATITDLEEAETAIIPDATPATPIFYDAVPRLYFRTKGNAARFAYDYQQSRRAENK